MLTLRKRRTGRAAPTEVYAYDSPLVTFASADADNTAVAGYNRLPNAAEEERRRRISQAHWNAAYSTAVAAAAGGMLRAQAGPAGVVAGAAMGTIVGVTNNCYLACHRK